MDERTVRLSILDSYGVRWSRDTFARDVLQNFFDATPDFAAIAIDVDRERRVVEVRGPVEFDVDLLAYIGATTKSDGTTAGGFGEGFKICALVGIRDFGLRMTAGSGALALGVFLDPVPLGRELCYRVGPRPEGERGSYVRLEGCDDACLEAFARAPRMFRHPDNPHLGEIVAEDAAHGVAVYASPLRGAGELYYRRQRRGQVPFYGTRGDRPVTLAHDAPIDALEGDRDRRDLPAGPLAEGIGDKLTAEALYRVLIHLMPYWERGNDVLHGLCAAAVRRKLRFSWPKGWLARQRHGKHGGLTEFAERQGLRIAVAAFAELGMPTADDHYGQLETRPPSALERARIEVVAGLYRELHGEPAKTSAYEVFDLAGAAVAGQHLGDKVIVAADLLAGDLDAAASTILHELAHEAGGEESHAFHRRLTRLLGAALREPERVEAARRRYAEAVPAPPEAPAAPLERKPPSAYAPEHTFDRDLMDYRGGIPCVLLVPPAFPPTRAILKAIKKASVEARAKVWLRVHTVTGPIGATRWLAPGLPTLLVSGADAGPGDHGPPGYRLRTYGRANDRVTPTRAAIRRALAHAMEKGLRGRKGELLQEAREDRGERLAQELYGAVPRRRVRKQPTAVEKRNAAVEKWLREFTGYGGYGLRALWADGLHAAGERLLALAASDGVDAAALWSGIKAALQQAMEVSRALRRADPDFDDADAMEREAMAAAQAAAALAFVQPGSPEQARERAGRAFRAVRDVTARALDAPIELDLKNALLEHVLEVAGLSDVGSRPEGIDDAGLAAEYERAAAIAVAYQEREDEDGGHAYRYTLENLLKVPKTEEARAADEARRADDARRERVRAKKTRRVKRAYDEALASTGSKLAAAARCLEEAVRQFPEEVPAAGTSTEPADAREEVEA